jgi:hypothetical protein
MRRLGFEPYESLEARPHVMVDGAARASSVLTLSHWPASPTPAALARDVSVEIVLEYLRVVRSLGSGAPARRVRPSLRAAVAGGALAEAVTNDHFDEDGVMSVFALVDPEAAFAQRELLVAVAMCGDFGVVASDVAARISFAIGPLAEAAAGSASGTSERYQAVLPLIPELLQSPDHFESYWAAEAEQLRVGQAALAAGEVEIAEHPDLDLAIVSRPAAGAGGRLPGADGGLPVHAAAVHSLTKASRILAFDGPCCELYLRYEGWVRTVSRRVPLRPDLVPVAERLSGEEPSGVAWDANGVGAIVGRLRPGGIGCSELSPARIVSVVREYLVSAEPAWDPWRPGAAFIPAQERQGYVSRRRRHGGT